MQRYQPKRGKRRRNTNRVVSTVLDIGTNNRGGRRRSRARIIAVVRVQLVVGRRRGKCRRRHRPQSSQLRAPAIPPHDFTLLYNRPHSHNIPRNPFPHNAPETTTTPRIATLLKKSRLHKRKCHNNRRHAVHKKPSTKEPREPTSSTSFRRSILVHFTRHHAGITKVSDEYQEDIRIVSQEYHIGIDGEG